MADTVTITSGANSTPPAGTVIATDDAGAGGQVQIVKLAISADGSATVIPADGTNGLSVDVKRIAAGDNNIGNVDIASALPAGTNAIGKLAANSGVDIGDVDVTSVPGALQGPGNPSVDSYASAAVDLAASTANQVLVAAPGASKQIWVYGLFMMADTAAGTVTLQDEDDTALSGTMAVSDEGGWVLPMSGNFAMPWIKVATNKALEADTGACTVDGILTYAVVSV